MNHSRPKKSILFALLIILSFTLILNLFLYAQLREYYTYLHAVELDPIGLSYFQNPEQKPDKNLRTFVFFGDSRTAQYQAGYEVLNLELEKLLADIRKVLP